MEMIRRMNYNDALVLALDRCLGSSYNHVYVRNSDGRSDWMCPFAVLQYCNEHELWIDEGGVLQLWVGCMPSAKESQKWWL